MKTLIRILTLILAAFLIIGFTHSSQTKTKPDGKKKVIVIKTLPSGYKTIKTNSRRIYTRDGIYYEKIKTGYKVVVPPAGTRIKYLPKGAKKRVIKYQSYYVKNNVYYKYNRRSNTYIVVKCPV